MLIIYTNNCTERLKYTFQLMFEHILGIPISFVRDKDTFLNSNSPKIVYDDYGIKDYLFFKKTDLLQETNIQNPKIEVQNHLDRPAFFFHGDKTAALPFDPFAMVFYLVSRYEEYLANALDAHHRFVESQSLAFQHHFLDRPIVNEWALVLKEMLLIRYPNLIFKERKYQFTPTYDVDYAWSYQHKGIIRTLIASLRDLIKNKSLFAQRVRVWLKKEKDPYFTFDYLDGLHQHFNLKPIYFFLVGQYGKYDKNISLQQVHFQKLIRDLALRYAIALHPSYRSNSQFRILNTEKENLQAVAQQAISKSRQHFLKLSFPTTYRRLLEAGIKEDYTMGYANQIGFRASIASPFFWFDLEKNEPTDLRVFPFQLMDVTLKNYLELSPTDAILQAKRIIKNTKAVNGHLITLFHNNSLCEQEGWQGWRAVYESILKEAVGKAK
jgi:hypothetical protein